MGDRFFVRKWDDPDEIKMLLDVNTNTDDVCELLGRSWMSVTIKRGETIPDLMNWVDSKGYDLVKGDIKEIIEEYLEEKKDNVREKRNEKKSKIKELEKLADTIRKRKTMIKSVELRIKAKVAFPEDYGIIKNENEKIKILSLEYYTKAIELDPNNVEFWIAKGDLLYNLSRFDEAIEYYEKALEFDSRNTEIWLNRGIALYYIKQYEEAIENFTEVINQNPEFDVPWFLRSCIYLKMKKKAKSISDLKKAIELNPSNRNRAIETEDFKNLWDDEDFKRLVE